MVLVKNMKELGVITLYSVYIDQCVCELFVLSSDWLIPSGSKIWFVRFLIISAMAVICLSGHCLYCSSLF